MARKTPVARGVMSSGHKGTIDGGLSYSRGGMPKVAPNQNYAGIDPRSVGMAPNPGDLFQQATRGFNGRGERQGRPN